MSARAMGSGTITFGLVSIPIKMYVAASSESVSFNQITASGNRVKQKLVDAVTGEEVQRDTLLKGYEHIKDQFVTFTQEEVKALEAEKSPVMDITEFVPLDTVDLLGVEKSYYLGPDKGADKGYALLSATMKETGKVAVARWAARGKEQLVVIRAYRGGLVLHQMFYSNEIRDFDEVVGSKNAKLTIHEAEKELAVKLVNQLSKTEFTPDGYKDEWSERVKVAVQQKVEGKEVTIVTENPKAQIVDLMEALKKSLSAS